MFDSRSSEKEGGRGRERKRSLQQSQEAVSERVVAQHAETVRAQYIIFYGTYATL